MIQPFLNYNLDGGWYLMTSPIVIANWYQKGGNVWTVPLGGGVGKLTKFGKQPVNINLQVYYNVARPENASDWSIRFNVQFLFPK